ARELHPRCARPGAVQLGRARQGRQDHVPVAVRQHAGGACLVVQGRHLQESASARRRRPRRDAGWRRLFVAVAGRRAGPARRIAAGAAAAARREHGMSLAKSIVAAGALAILAAGLTQARAADDWANVVAKAKQEGLVVVHGAPGKSYAKALQDEFSKAYPEI